MPLRFTKKLIAAQAFEAAVAVDVDGDGQLDIVCGGFWYRGPDFRECYLIRDVQRVGEYYDDFSAIPMDVTGSGRPDIITGGWWGNTLRWRENPADPTGEWAEHIIAEVGHVETTRAWDVDGDGDLEIVPNTPGSPLCFYKLVRDAEGRGTGKFTVHTVCEKHGHGLGFGDIDGDGRGDFVVPDGWYQAPEDPLTGEWVFHPEFDLGPTPGIPILVVDVNGDGLNDLIVGGGHQYGLDWWQQRRAADGSREWIKHPIDPFNSQYHDLQWADIDGDGQSELITGKRYRAHCGKDPGAFDEIGIYIFKWTGDGFAKQAVSYGELGVGAGCGIQFDLADLRGTGRLDILAPGKDGLHVFYNEGN